MTNYLAPAAIVAALAASASAPPERVAAAAGASALQRRGDALNLRECLRKAWRRDPDLPRATQATRDALVRDPSAIGAIAAAARAAAPARRAEMELGVLNALEYLKCVDAPGYAALSRWLAEHPDDVVTIDLAKASTATASLDDGAAAAPAPADAGAAATGPSSEAGALAASPFYGAGPVVSQH